MKTFLILILSVVCIAVQTPYFFKTSNMMMYELIISAIPSFVLSMQPNTNRVKGKFIPHVLSKAIPGALTMALGILSLYVIYRTPLGATFGFVSENGATLEYSAMMMLALTAMGCVMLYRICQPLNILRFILLVFSIGLCITVVSIPFLGEFVFKSWSTVQFNLQQILLLVIIVQASIPLSGVLMNVFDMMNPADD
jgi:cation-transporting ATPase E